MCLVACAAERGPVIILDAKVDGGRLELSVNTCQGSPELARLVETPERVEITVVADAQGDGPRPGCADGVHVELDEPLGTRTLLDGVTGEPITIR